MDALSVVIIGVSLALLGAFTWILPSAGERARSKLRMQAITCGVKVRMPDKKWFEEHRYDADDRARRAVFYEWILPPDHTHAGSWVWVCDSKEGWRLSGSSGQLRQGGVPPIISDTTLSALPPGVCAFERTPATAAVLYDESGGEDELRSIIKWLKAL